MNKDWASQLKFAELEKEHGIPSGILNAVMQTESSGNPNAVSPVGAKGLFQFMPNTAEGYGVDPLNPESSAKGAAKMLGDLNRQFKGELPKILAGYNWGSGNVTRKGMDNAPKETRDYIEKIQRILPTEYAQADTGTMTDWYEEAFQPKKEPVQAAPASSKTDWYKEAFEPSPGSWGGPSETLSQGGEAGFDEMNAANPVEDISKMFGFTKQAVASLPSDPKDKARYFASQRFPNISQDEALSRYGVQDGRVFYQDDDGKSYFEEPGDTNLTNLTRKAGSLAGPAIPAVTSLAGGMASAPAGGIPGATVGAAAGDAVRQGLSEVMIPGDQEYNYGQTALEAGMGAIGQGIGVSATKFANRKVARDIARIETPEAKAAIDELSKKADEWKIDLTPAEKTNLKSLKAEQNVLGDLPRSSDVMDAYYQKRNREQIPRAADELFSKFSTQESPEVLAQSGQEGAKAAINAERQALKDQATPYYDASRNVSIPLDKYKKLIDDPLLRREIKSVAGSVKYQSDLGDLIPMAGKEAETEAKIGFLDVVKKQLDGKIDAAQTTGNRNDVRIYTQAKQRLLNAIDNEDYAMARSIYEEGMPNVTALTKGEVGAAAKKTPMQMDKVPDTLFNTGEKAIAFNRKKYMEAGQDQQWNDALAGYLRKTFDSAHKETLSGNVNPGARWRNALLGKNPDKQIKAMRAAMGDEQFRGFTSLMDVLEATGRVPQGGSRTAFAGEAIADMKARSGGIPAKMMDVASSPVSILNGTLKRGYNNLRLGSYSENLAEMITSPDAMLKLKDLQNLSPNSVKARVITSQLLTRYGIISSRDTLFPQQNVPLGGFVNGTPRLQ